MNLTLHWAIGKRAKSTMAQPWVSTVRKVKVACSCHSTLWVWQSLKLGERRIELARVLPATSVGGIALACRSSEPQ